ncbi:Enamine deaminase RidA, house cleaning of reactive enamine intermediates, YjgF/YER057c/UK114 family [Prevotella sp. KH2C16]|nr:Enamine deaminase RidA, house cleaning of reactive enamine intermediates, YjgF/YER057c/UK114 family [Prevotella sp. KH2C16]
MQLACRNDKAADEFINLMNKYFVVAPVSRGSFADQIDEVYRSVAQIEADAVVNGCHLQYAKVALSDVQNQYDELTGSRLYEDYLSRLALTVVEQPPLCGSKISVLLKVSDETDDFLFFSMRLTAEECKGQTSHMQAVLLFRKVISLLGERHLTLLDNCLRTWIYVADIDINYAGVVKARNDIFSDQGLSAATHFIASTGIGGYSQTREACVAIDFLIGPDARGSDMKYLHAPDHLNPAHEYGVAFERGTRLSTPFGQTFFISGTASIDTNGQVMFQGDVLRQADRLLENIQSLLRDGGADLQDVQYFMVYLRDAADYERIDSYMKEHFPDTPCMIVNAKVCRPEWLVEMECIARKGNSTMEA